VTKEYFLGKKLEDFNREEREAEEKHRDKRPEDIDFTEHEPDPVLEDEFFGGFRPSADEFSRDWRVPRGWAAEPSGEPQYLWQAIRAAEQGKLPKPMPEPIALPMARPFTAQGILHEERAHFYAEHTARRVQALFLRQYKPSRVLEEKWFSRLKRIKTNPLLTKQYLYGEPRLKLGDAKRWSRRIAVPVNELVRGKHEPTPGISQSDWQAKQREWKQLGEPKTEWPSIRGPEFVVETKSKKQIAREESNLLMAAYLAKGGKITVCPPEMTTEKMAAVKIGRPTIYDHAMTPAERQRRRRAKTDTAPAPNRRLQPGAVQRSPFTPAAPGPFFHRGMIPMANEKERIARLRLHKGTARQTAR